MQLILRHYSEKGDWANKANYRTISILPHLSAVLDEKHITSYILSFFLKEYFYTAIQGISVQHCISCLLEK